MIFTVKELVLLKRVQHEDLLWEKGILGLDTPKALQRAVFYYVGLQFVLRGIQEHHDLQVEQLN